MKTILPLALAAIVLPVAAIAQERTAGQAYDAQVNWAALKGMFDKVDAQNKILAATLTKMQVCAAKDALYKPGDSTADADGCVVTGGLKLGEKIPLAPTCTKTVVYYGAMGLHPATIANYTTRPPLRFGPPILTNEDSGRLVASYYTGPTTSDYCTRTYDGKGFSDCVCVNFPAGHRTDSNSWGN